MKVNAAVPNALGWMLFNQKDAKFNNFQGVMNMKALVMGLTALASIAVALPAAAAEPAKIMSLVRWDKSHDREKVLAMIAKGNALDRKFGCGCTIRLWEESLGGDSGLVLQIEWKSMLAMAQYQQKFADAPEWAAWYKEVAASGIGPGNTTLVTEIIVP